MKAVFRALALLCMGSMVLALQGCANVGGGPNVGQDPRDPWERWNRQVYAFNDVVDDAVLKPVATTYQNVVPALARQGVGNFFGNFSDAWSSVNNLLQGKLEGALKDFFRVSTNTFFGLGGVLDIATEMGIDRQSEDFGQTLGRWGFADGPFVVWPLLGPSNLRDSFALPLDFKASPNLVVNDSATRTGLTVLRVVDIRSNLLAATRMLDDIALDPYTFTRDAYLQQRRNSVFDGNPPQEPQDLDDAPSAADTPKK